MYLNHFEMFYIYEHKFMNEVSPPTITLKSLKRNIFKTNINSINKSYSLVYHLYYIPVVKMK